MKEKNFTLNTILFVVLAYAFSWVCFLAYIVPHSSSLDIAEAMPYLMVGQFGPTIAALAITAREQGLDGVKKFASRIFVFKVPIRWWAAATWGVGLAVIVAAFAGLMALDSGEVAHWAAGLGQAALLPLFGFITLVNSAGPLGEEPGWRGFLLPRLVDRFSTVKTNLIIGVIWTFWHAPLFFIPNFRNGLDLPSFLVFYLLFVIIVSFGLYYTWKNGRGSIILCIVCHSCINIATSIFLPNTFNPIVANIVMDVGVLAWVVLARLMDNRALPRNPYTI